ncbi:TPA: major capsid protein, partial [Escherichia coli]
WCAPSETIYDFLPTPAAANLFSLPEISLSRGGLRYPVEPDFSTLYATNRGTMTEAQAISGQTKDCIEIPCAEMQEVRMDVLWTCVTSNLLANTGWPELTAKFLENATKGHLHRLSAARLAKVIALSKKVAVGVPALGTAGT